MDRKREGLMLKIHVVMISELLSHFEQMRKPLEQKVINTIAVTIIITMAWNISVIQKMPASLRLR